jgi:Transglycosylase SLT domain
VPARSAARRKRTAARQRRKSPLVPSARTRRRALRALKSLRRAPPSTQVAVGFALTLALWVSVNTVYQVVKKPTELFFPVSGTLHKRPAETWSEYQAIFRKHSTAAISPEFLAALAQVEASGNPIARTYWRWTWTLDPLEVYRPASSAVGMYQITDGTFDQARRYCIHRHVVVQDGPWYAWRSCWFNWLYFRVVPSHAVELTSAYLDRAVAGALARYRIRSATPAQKENLAALIHLCGAGVGDRYAKRGLQFSAGLRCGDHDAASYVARVNVMKRVFAGYASHSQ